jgi:hypothetical protein
MAVLAPEERLRVGALSDSRHPSPLATRHRTLGPARPLCPPSLNGAMWGFASPHFHWFPFTMVSSEPGLRVLTVSVSLCHPTLSTRVTAD